LNVHRRHAASVTHALDADRHVNEIARCHAIVRQVFAPPAGVCANQEAYAKEVAQQLGARPMKPNRAASRSRDRAKASGPLRRKAKRK
jgi:hypothetical protein